MYEKIVRLYLNYLEENYGEEHPFRTSKYKMKEFLRHSICVGLGMHSVAKDEVMQKDAQNCADYILRDVDLHISQYQKHYILESCIHCLTIVLKGVKGTRHVAGGGGYVSE